jgi:hypothetical protein
MLAWLWHKSMSDLPPYWAVDSRFGAFGYAVWMCGTLFGSLLSVGMPVFLLLLMALIRPWKSLPLRTRITVFAVSFLVSLPGLVVFRILEK